MFGHHAVSEYAVGATLTAPSNPSISPSVGAVSLAGYAAAVAIGVVTSVGSVSVQGNTPVTYMQAGTDYGGGAGGLLFALNTLLTPPANLTASPSTGTVTIAGQQVQLSLGIFPSVGSVSLTGNQLTLTGTKTISPSVGTVVLSGNQPVIGGAGTIIPSVGVISLTGQSPGVRSSIGPSVGALALTGYQPTLTIPASVTPSAGIVTVSGYQPSVIAGGAGGGGRGGLLVSLNLNWEANLNPSPNSGSLSLVGNTPTLVGASGSSGTGLLAALGSLTQAASIIGEYRPQTGSLAFTGYAPAPSRSVTDIGWDEFVAEPATFSGTGFKGASYDPRTSYPLVGSIAITGNTPVVARSVAANPLKGTLAVVGYTPGLTRQFVFQPASGALTLSSSNALGYGYLDYGRSTYGTPRVPAVQSLTGPQTGIITIIGNQVALQRTYVVSPSVGSLSLVGYTPTIPVLMSPLAGTIALSGNQPAASLGSPLRTPSTGSLLLSGNQPTLQRGYNEVSAVFTAGRAFLEVYTDYFSSALFNAGFANVYFATDQSSLGTGDFIAQPATVTNRNWDTQPTDGDNWTRLSDQSDQWTELNPSSDTWNG
jgi:hypothetical protein